MTKFHDQDRDGIHDYPLERYIDGWLIFIADPGGNTRALTTRQCIGVPALVTYTVSEALQIGWTQTFPAGTGTHQVFVECGQLVNLEFGNSAAQPAPPTNTPKIPPID